MILFHNSLKRSDDLMRSLKSRFFYDCKTIDGVIEVFNNKIGQGFMLKIFQSYNRDNDLVIWLFEDIVNKKIMVAYSTQENIDKNNNWVHQDKVNMKEYPIKANIKVEIIKNVFDNVKDYYHLNESIEVDKEFKI